MLLSFLCRWRNGEVLLADAEFVPDCTTKIIYACQIKTLILVQMYFNVGVYWQCIMAKSSLLSIVYVFICLLWGEVVQEVSKKIKRGDASCTPVAIAWHLVRAASEELEGWRWQPSTSSHWLTPGPRRHSMCAASALPVQCYLRPLRGHHR